MYTTNRSLPASYSQRKRTLVASESLLELYYKSAPTKMRGESEKLTRVLTSFVVKRPWGRSDGHENLTASLPRTTEELESLTAVSEQRR